MIGDGGRKLDYTIHYRSSQRDFVILKTSLPSADCPLIPDAAYVDSSLLTGQTRFLLRQASGSIVQRDYRVVTFNSDEVYAEAIEAGRGFSEGMSGGTLALDGAAVAISTSETVRDGRPVGRFIRIDRALAEEGELSEGTTGAELIGFPATTSLSAVGKVPLTNDWPTNAPILSDFNSKASRWSPAIVFDLHDDRLVHVIGDGVVEDVARTKTSILVVVRHAGELKSLYRGCIDTPRKEGDVVRRGDILGVACPSKAKLAFEVHAAEAVIDPLSVLGPRIARVKQSANASVATHVSRADIAAIAERAGVDGDFIGGIMVPDNWLAELPEPYRTNFVGRVPAALSGSLDVVLAQMFTASVSEFRGELADEDALDVWPIRPTREDIFQLFLATLKSGGPLTWIAQWLSSDGAEYPGEVWLRQALKTYRDIQVKGGWPKLDLHSTDDDIVRRLRIEQPRLECLDIKDCVSMAQRRYGLEPTGIFDAELLGQLNTPVERRLDSIESNVERWRWLNGVLPDLRMQVNTVAGVATVFDGDGPVASFRTSAGTADQPQPIFSASISSVDVTAASIALRNSPVATVDPDQAVLDTGTLLMEAETDAVPADDASSDDLDAGTYLASDVREIRFNFSNSFDLKMSYDARRKDLFGQHARPSLDGNILLERGPSLLAALLNLSGERGRNYNVTRKSDRELRIEFAEPIAIYGLYWTAFTSANGVVNFQPDAYEWDTVIAGALKRARSTTSSVSN